MTEHDDEGYRYALLDSLRNTTSTNATLTLDRGLIQELIEYDEEHDTLGSDAMLTDFTVLLCRAFPRCSHVTELHIGAEFLHEIPLGAEQLLFRRMAGLPSLRKFKILGDEGSGVSSQWFSYKDLFRSCPDLLHFETPELFFRSIHDITQFADLLRGQQQLETLRVSCVHFHTEAHVSLDMFYRVAMQYPNLKTFDLSPCSDSNVSLSPSCLREFLEHQTTLESFGQSCILRDEHCHILKQVGVRHRFLTHLDLSQNDKLTIEGLKSILELVKENPRIVSLDIDQHDSDDSSDEEEEDAEDEDDDSDEDEDDEEDDGSQEDVVEAAINLAAAVVATRAVFGSPTNSGDPMDQRSRIEGAITVWTDINKAGRRYFMQEDANKAVCALILANASRPDIIYHLLLLKPDLVNFEDD
jgi:hypothetical protein